MVSRLEPGESLQQRVNKILRGNPMAYSVEEPDEESVEAISTLLLRAEEEVKSAQKRVDRLRWELERARSQFTPDQPRSRKPADA